METKGFLQIEVWASWKSSFFIFYALFAALLIYIDLRSRRPRLRWELPDNLAYCDEFGRMDPRELRERRGMLARAARILQGERIAELLGRRFAVITSAGKDRVEFPLSVEPGPQGSYLAVASKYRPRALFFIRTFAPLTSPLSLSLHIVELGYKIRFHGERGALYGVSLRRRTPRRCPHLHRKLSSAEITLENLEEPIRAFVDREILASSRHHRRQEPAQMEWKLPS